MYLNMTLLCFNMLLLMGAISKYTDATRKLVEVRQLSMRVLLNKKKG